MSVSFHGPEQLELLKPRAPLPLHPAVPTILRAGGRRRLRRAPGAAGDRGLPRNGVTGSTGLISQTRSIGAGRLSWVGGSTAWTGPDRHGLPSQAARSRRAGAAAMKLGFAGE